MSEQDPSSKWQGWIDVISKDLGRSLLRRSLFEATMKIYDANPMVQKEGGAFFWFFSGLYLDTIASGIRRQAKKNDDSVCLRQLLEEIEERPEVLSRERYRSHYVAAGQAIDGRVDREFDQLGGAGAHLDPTVVRADLTQLKAACLAAEGYVDRRVAHYDRRHPREELTPSQVNLALETLETLVEKYFLLLNGSSLVVEPALQVPFSYVFSFPWIPPEEKPGQR